MSIRSLLVNQHKNKLISHSEQLFHAQDSLPITFGIIFLRIHVVENQQILKIICIHG